MTAPRAWSVTLSFAPPGPLYSTLILAPDRESAVAIATLGLMQNNPTEAQLHAVLASEVPAETLRHMLRAVESGAEVMRLVPADAEAFKRLAARVAAEVTMPLHPARRVMPPLDDDDGPAAA